MSQLKISTRKVLLKDLHPGFKRAGIAQLDLQGYTPIFQWGYGRMDASTPGKGMSSSGVASCICVVLHCRETNRTILTHSPNFLIMQPTFSPMVEWIIGGSPKLDEESEPQSPLEDSMKRLKLSIRAGSGGVQQTVQAVVIRGYDYATPRALLYGHEGWMRDFRNFFATFSLLYSIRADILDCPQILTAGSLIVDKENGDITFLDLARNSKVPRHPLWVVDSSISERDEYSSIQQSQDLFMGSLLGVHTARFGPGINLQYDVDHYLLPLKLTDEARYLIRSRDMRESQASQGKIIRMFGLSEDWVTKETLKGGMARMMFDSLMETGPPCERCGKRGMKRCGECRAAWYCSVEHQREDWRIHKPWCRVHKLK